MRVLKFGGTSLADGRRIRRVARLIRRAARGRRIVVVASAMAGITDWLCSLIESAEAATPVDRDVAEVERRHLEVLETLDPSHRLRAIDTIRQTILRLRRDLHDIAAPGDCAGQIRDRIMATGERLSVEVLAAVLRSSGCAAEAVDGSELIVTDDRFGEARVDLDATRRLCARLGTRPAGEVPVVTGFIGADAKGRTTTLGRGGSDFSAAILGAVLDADRVEIWTDVDGVLTAPPRIVADASWISRLSFEEAAELAHFGAKVLHRRTVEPLAARGIPILVRNTFDSSRPGTEIGPGEPLSSRVAAITAICEATVFSVMPIGDQRTPSARPPLMIGPADEILMTCSASSDGSVLIAASAAKAAGLAQRLAEATDMSITDRGPASVIALVGHNLGLRPWVAGRALDALARRGLSVRAFAAGSSPHALTILVNRDEIESVLKTVHAELRLDGGPVSDRPVAVIKADLMAEEVVANRPPARHRRAS